MPDIFSQSVSKDRDRRFDDTLAVATTIPQPTTTNAPENNAVTQQKSSEKKSSMHLFTAFSENPPNITFETQEPDEKILVFIRKSNFMNISWYIATVILLVLPFLAYLLRSQYKEFIPPLNFLMILAPLYYLMVFTYAFVQFITWYYNAALITSKRVVDIDFHQLVLKEVDETKLALVQDVSFKQDGVFENIFDFGYVLIQTAGTIDNFEFWGLPQPDRVVQIVQELIGGKRFYEP